MLYILCAVTVVAIGFTTLLEYISQNDLGIDQLIFYDDAPTRYTSHPGRMASLTALMLLMSGLALLTFDLRNKILSTMARIFNWATGAVALLACFGYLYGVREFYAFRDHTSVAIHTAILFILVFTAILFSRLDIGIMKIITAENFGGIFARRLLPVAIITPIFLGWLRLAGQHYGLYGTEIGIGIMVLSNIYMLVGIGYIVTAMIGRLDDKSRLLQARCDQLYHAVEQSPSIVLITDIEGNIQYANPRFCLTTGYSNKEIIGRKANILKSGERPAEDYTELWKTITSDKEWHGEFHNRKKDGSLYWEEASVSAVKNASGNTIGFIKVAEDATKRKALEKLKEDYIHIITHDLRAPLTITQESGSQLIEGLHGQITEGQRNYLSIILKTTSRMKRLLDNLLDVSRLEDGKIALNREKFDFNEVISDTVNAFSLKAESKGLLISLNSSNTPIIVNLDKDKLLEITTNLVSNAIKYTDKGRIDIFIRDAGQRVECAVKDTGRGISPQDLPHVFEKFRQFGRHDSNEEKGTGLGLCIVKNLVELHKGTIRFESALGQGTTFIFTLPKEAPLV